MKKKQRIKIKNNQKQMKILQLNKNLRKKLNKRKTIKKIIITNRLQSKGQRRIKINKRIKMYLRSNNKQKDKIV